MIFKILNDVQVFRLAVPGVMASQNVAPSSAPSSSSSSKASGSCLAAPKDGHSVTKRLQQDLMKLMVDASFEI